MVKQINTMWLMKILMLFVLGIISVSLSIHTAQGAEKFKPQPIVSLSQSTAWQRQQVTLTVEIPTPDEFSRIEFEALDLQDFEVIQLPFKRSEVPGEKNQYTVKIGWILFPLVAGQYEIELPQVVYRPNGGRKIKLKISPQSLNVKSLPRYIPATMAIGSVEIKTSINKASLGKIHDTQTLIDWKVELLTTNVLPQTIPPILRQVKASKALDVFPETLTKTFDKSYSGLKSNLHYKIPIKALQSGALDLPALSIQYFDPEDGKLKRANASPVNHWAINRYIQWFILAIFALLLLFGLNKLIKYASKHFRNWQNVRLAMAEIENAKNTQEVRQALHKLSKAKGWGENITLQQAMKSWQTQKGKGSQLKDSINALQAEQFSGKSSKSFESIKNELINSLKRA